MTEKKLHIGPILGMSLLAGAIGMLIAQLILPAVVSTFQTSLEHLHVVDAANWISWTAILVTFVGIVFAVVLLGREFMGKALVGALFSSLICTILLTMVGSFLYITIVRPDVFMHLSVGEKLLRGFTYPTIVSLLVESPQPIWIATTGVFVLLFNMAFYYLTEVPI